MVAQIQNQDSSASGSMNVVSERSMNSVIERNVYFDGKTTSEVADHRQKSSQEAFISELQQRVVELEKQRNQLMKVNEDQYDELQ